MLVSFNKNKWIYEWVKDNWRDELYEILEVTGDHVPRHEDLRVKFNNLLISKGYTTKITSKLDILISMKDEDYVFLKLKYQ